MHMTTNDHTPTMNDVNVVPALRASEGAPASEWPDAACVAGER